MRFALLSLAVIVASPALAKNPDESNGQTAPASASSTEKAPKEKKRCRKIEGETGSRVSGKRVCLTAEEWKQFDRENR